MAEETKREIERAIMVWLCPREYHGGLIDLDLDYCPTGPLCRESGCQKDD
jgi:hypothetical protein